MKSTDGFGDNLTLSAFSLSIYNEFNESPRILTLSSSFLYSLYDFGDLGDLGGFGDWGLPGDYDSWAYEKFKGNLGVFDTALTKISANLTSSTSSFGSKS